MDEWTEIVVEVEQAPDEALLLDRVAPLIERLRPSLASWHFFWEPDLWVRLRWRAGADRDAAEGEIAGALEGLAWRHGEYAGDAAMMGAEMWARCERDFEHGAEYAVALLRHERDGTASRDRDFHWTRRVHTLTNQLTGSWAEEARLSARQLRYRAWLLGRTLPAEARGEVDAVVDRVDAVLAEMGRLAEVERAALARWRSADRPPLTEIVDLPEWFDYDPDRAMGPKPSDAG